VRGLRKNYFAKAPREKEDQRKVNPKKVKEAVEEIRDVCYDDEMAHEMEDKLYADLIRAIALGRCVNVQECALEALKTKHMEFHRWVS